MEARARLGFSAAVPPLAGRRVLLADGCEASRDAWAVALRRAGADVLSATGRDDAMAVWRTTAAAGRRVDAIVLGAGLPEADLLPAIALLRRAGFAGAAVGVAADLTPQVAASWVWSGCDLVLSADRPGDELAAEVAFAAAARGEP